jgi:hypothetical protein
MKYLTGFILAYILLYVVFKFQNKNNILKEPKIKPIRYSQSHLHSLVYPLLPKDKKIKSTKKTQSSIHEAKNNIRVIIMNNVAYWIKDTAFYMADVNLDGSVNKDTTKRVDTATMNKVQLDQMLFIVDKLREGTFDDSGSAGN